MRVKREERREEGQGKEDQCTQQGQRVYWAKMWTKSKMSVRTEERQTGKCR